MGVRVRNFCGICYEENFTCVTMYLKRYVDKGQIRAYYFIMHEPDSEEKQRHFHFLVEYYDAKTKASIVKNINKFTTYYELPEYKERFLEVCTDVRGYASYLIHKYELDKKRYMPTEVETNDNERYRMLISSDNSIQCSNDKEIYRKFRKYLTQYIPLDTIFDLLLEDKNITVRDVRKNTYLFKTIYIAFHSEEGKFNND